MLAEDVAEGLLFIVARSPWLMRHSRNGNPSPMCPRMILKAGMGIEHAAQDEAQALGRGLDCESPGGTEDLDVVKPYGESGEI